MSLSVDPTTGDPVHYPKRRDVFEFDEEVSKIFDNMAERSIPMYAEMHNVHAALVHDYIHRSKEELSYAHPISIMDIGASTTTFIDNICNRLQKSKELTEDPIAYLDITCLDTSKDMLDGIRSRIPWVNTIVGDILELNLEMNSLDVINMTYLLQFIKDPIQKQRILSKCHDALRPGGMLFLGQKDGVDNQSMPRMERVTSVFNAEYIEFRKDNGYSEHEIRAKTEALKQAMFPISYEHLYLDLRMVGFDRIAPTVRWLQFNACVCVKN